MKLSDLKKSSGIRLSELTARASRRDAIRAKDKEDYNPTKGMNLGEEIVAGNSAEAKRLGRRATNLLLPDSLTPEWATDEAIQKQDELDVALNATGGGMTGRILGGLALTAPLGGPVGAGAKALAAGSTVARAAPTLARTLRAGATMAGVEGGMQGALFSNPGEGLEGALKGAVLGGGLSKGAQLVGAGGRALKRTLGAELSDEAVTLQKLLGHNEFIPLSQSAKPGVWKQIYSGLVANTPKAGQVLRGQREAALGRYNEFVLTKALPYKTSKQSVFLHGEDTLHEGFRKGEDLWKAAFGKTNKMEFTVTPNFISKSVRQAIDDLPNSSFKIPVPKNNKLKGQQIEDLKQILQDAINETRPGVGGMARRNELIRAKKNLEKIILRKLKLGVNTGKLPHDALRERLYNTANYDSWGDLVKAAKTSKGKPQLEPKQILASAGSGKEGVMGEGGRLQKYGILGEKALEDFPSKQGIFQTVAALGVMSAAGGVGAATSDNPVLGGLAGFVAPIALARGLASPSFQRLISGQASKSGKVKVMTKMLRGLGAPARQAAVAARAITERDNAQRQ
jgi:hypothetical protein